MNTATITTDTEALHAKAADLINGDGPFWTAPPVASIASVANRTSVLAAIGDALPEVAAGGPQAVRIVSLHGPCALPTAIAVDEVTSADRRHGKPSERWDLVVVDADADPQAIYARRASRTVILACTSQPLPGHPAIACN